MSNIIVPANISTFAPEMAAEMCARDPDDERLVRSIGELGLVPVEVYADFKQAAERAGVSLEQFIVSAAYKTAIERLTGSVND